MSVAWSEHPVVQPIMELPIDPSSNEDVGKPYSFWICFDSEPMFQIAVEMKPVDLNNKDPQNYVDAVMTVTAMPIMGGSCDPVSIPCPMQGSDKPSA